MKNTEIMRIYVIYRDADVLSHTVIGISNRVLLLEYSINFKNIFHFLLCVMLTSAIHITHSLRLQNERSMAAYSSFLYYVLVYPVVVAGIIRI